MGAASRSQATWVGCVEEVCLGIVDSEGGPVTSTVGHPSAGDPNMHGKLFWPEFSPDGDRVAVLGGLIDFTFGTSGHRNVHAVRL